MSINSRALVSFTDTPFELSENHRTAYGHFGIAIDKDWAIATGASKVLYIGSGTPVFHSLHKPLSIDLGFGAGFVHHCSFRGLNANEKMLRREGNFKFKL